MSQRPSKNRKPAGNKKDQLPDAIDHRGDTEKTSEKPATENSEQVLPASSNDTGNGQGAINVEKTKPETVTVAQAAVETLAEIPAPNLNAIAEQEEKRKIENPETPANTSDGSGISNPSPPTPIPLPSFNPQNFTEWNDVSKPPPQGVYDPYKRNDDGTAVKNDKGVYIKKGGRKPGPNYSPQQSALNQPQPAPVSQPQTGPSIVAQNLGAVSAQMFVNVTCLFFQTREWEPRGAVEESKLTETFQQFYQATGLQDFPPSIMLLIGLGMYAGPRLRMPDTSKVIKGYGEKLGLIPPEPESTQGNLFPESKLPETESENGHLE